MWHVTIGIQHSASVRSVLDWRFRRWPQDEWQVFCHWGQRLKTSDGKTEMFSSNNVRCAPLFHRPRVCHTFVGKVSNLCVSKTSKQTYMWPPLPLSQIICPTCLFCFLAHCFVWGLSFGLRRLAIENADTLTSPSRMHATTRHIS